MPVSMGLTISDITRAILGGGDISVFAKVWHQALLNPSVPSIPSLEASEVLPEATALLKHVDDGLESVVAAWSERKDYQSLPKAEIDLTLIGLAPYGRNIGSYLEHIIDEVSPDIIAIDTSPLGLSASMLYAFSLPCAIGLPAYGETLAREGGQSYASETFYPGNMNETAIVKSWLAKIPLLPVGVPQKPGRPVLSFQLESVDETYVDWEMFKSRALTAYRALDENLGGVTKLKEGVQITGDICLSLMETIGSKMRETLAEEACYIASRIMEIATYANTGGRKARLLAIVDIAHYPDVEYVTGLLKLGITDEIYVPPKSYAGATTIVMGGRDYDKLKEQAKEYAPESTLTQALFRSEFDQLIKTKDSEILPESRVDKLISEIVSLTRTHPEIARGASVRGTIAFKEILQGLSEMQGGLTRDSFSKAALITLPPRISARQGANVIAIVSDIVKEVLYDIRFSRVRDETLSSIALDWLSPEDIIEGLKSLKPLFPGRNQELTQEKLPAIIAEPGKNQEMLKYLESQKFLKKGQQNQYSFTKKALEYLIDDLCELKLFISNS